MDAVIAKTLSRLCLLVLLSLPGGARAIRWDDEPDCRANTHPPKISYKTTSMDNFEDPGEFIDVLYGDDITVLCTGDVRSLGVQKTDKQLKINKHTSFLDTEKVNSTMIQWTIRRPDVGRVRYRCVDTVSKCQDSLYFMIAPLASVVSAGIHHVLRSEFDKRFIFFVPFGETYQIFCSGSDSKSLKIRLDSWTLLPTIALNETTVMYEGRADRVGTFYYTCSGEETAWFDIIMDYPPEAQEFRCTSYNKDKLACSWRASSPTNTFKLFYKESLEQSKLLCSDMLVGTKRACKWHKRFIWDSVFFTNYDIWLQLEMQTCNEVFCRNYTFKMPHISITKLDPVTNLTVINTSSGGAVVSWPVPRQGYSLNERKIFKHVYKVEFRLLQKRWRQANASSVRCDYKRFSKYNRCELEMKLDCPEQHYELRVYVRLEAADDRLWSEPASKIFYTAPADGAPAPACAALQEPDLITSRGALSKVFKLIGYTIERKSVLRKRVRDMRLKLGVIKSKFDALAAVPE